MQVDPIKPTSKAPGSKHLKLNYDYPPSESAFKFKLRHYSKAAEVVGYTSDEVMGRDFIEDFITPGFKVSVKEVLDNSLQGIVTSSYEFPLFSKTGHRVELLVRRCRLTLSNPH